MYFYYIQDPYSDKIEFIHLDNAESLIKKIKAANSKYSDEFDRLMKSTKNSDKTFEVDQIAKFIEHQYNNLNLREEIEVFNFNSLRKIYITPLAPEEPIDKISGRIPRRQDKKYQKELSFFSKFFMKKIISHYSNLNKEYLKDNEAWLKHYDKIQKENSKANTKYDKDYANYEKLLEEKAKNEEKNINDIKRFKDNIIYNEVEAIELFLNNMFSGLRLPLINFQHNLKCEIDGNTLRIDAHLPLVDNLINIKGSRYVKTRKRTDVIRYKPAQLNKFYHDLVLKYIASISQLLNVHSSLIDFDTYIINGITQGKKNKEYVTTISTKTNKDGLFDGKTIDQWYQNNDFYVGKKLSNYTKLKETY